MATIVIDVDLDAPPTAALDLGHRAAVRALIWKGRYPVGQLTLPAAGQLDPGLIVSEAFRLLAPQIEETVRRTEELPIASLPFVTVAICSRDRTEDLERCLQHLKAQVAPPRHEILVIDNAPSDDRTRALIQRLEAVRYVREDLPGQNFARNRALRETRAEILAYLDDDTRPAPGWLRAVAEAFARDPAVTACSGPVPPAELETGAQELYELAGGFRQTFQYRTYGAEYPGDEVNSEHWPAFSGLMGSGCNMAFRTAVLRSLGGFDEALDTVGLPGGGDQDMFYRLIRSGYRLAYEPAMLARHRHRRELRALRRQVRETWNKGTVAFLVKCWYSDPELRPVLRRALLSVFEYHLRRFRKFFWYRGPDRFPPGLILAELLGAVKGLYAYPLSARRARRLRHGTLQLAEKT